MVMRRQVHEPEGIADHAALVLPLDALDRTLLPIVGGKGANLGELIRVGFSVPGGFCVTTAAYVQVSAALEPILAEMATLHNDSARLAELASTARSALQQAAMPSTLAQAILDAYQEMGENVAVAVRSSATAEDLSFASFAGQQETYLNVVGSEALLRAVQDCWASLWTERAVSYRQSLGLDQRTVSLAVVVQRLIPSEVSGVLFTANPLTGNL